MDVCSAEKLGEGDAFHRQRPVELISRVDGRDNHVDDGVTTAGASAAGGPQTREDLLSLAETMISCSEGGHFSMGFVDDFIESPGDAVVSTDISPEFDLMEEKGDVWGVVGSVEELPEGDGCGGMGDDDWLCLLDDPARGDVEEAGSSLVVPFQAVYSTTTGVEVNMEGVEINMERRIPANVFAGEPLSIGNPVSACVSSSLCSSSFACDSLFGIAVPAHLGASERVDGEGYGGCAGETSCSREGTLHPPCDDGVEGAERVDDAPVKAAAADVSSAPAQFSHPPLAAPTAVDDLLVDMNPKEEVVIVGGGGGDGSTTSIRPSTHEEQLGEPLMECVERPVPSPQQPSPPVSDSRDRRERCCQGRDSLMGGVDFSRHRSEVVGRETLPAELSADTKIDGDGCCGDGTNSEQMNRVGAAVHMVASDGSSLDFQSSGGSIIPSSSAPASGSTAVSSSDSEAETAALPMVVPTTDDLAASSGGTSAVSTWTSPTIERGTGRGSTLSGLLEVHSFPPYPLPHVAVHSPTWPMTSAGTAQGELIGPVAPVCAATKSMTKGVPSSECHMMTSASDKELLVNDSPRMSASAIKNSSSEGESGGERVCAQGGGYGMAKSTNNAVSAVGTAGEGTTSPASSEGNNGSLERCRGGVRSPDATSSLCSGDSGARDYTGNHENGFSGGGGSVVRHGGGARHERGDSADVVLSKKQQQQQQQQQRKERRSSSWSSTSMLNNPSSPEGGGEGGGGGGGGEGLTEAVAGDDNGGGCSGGGDNSDEGVKSSNSDADKKQARLLRNRESAQLSRQRKKVYVDDLENRLRTMAATIAELNATIAHLTADNVALRRQLGYFYPAPPPAGAPPTGMAGGGAGIGGGVGGMCSTAPPAAHMYGAGGAPMMLPRHPGVMPPLGVAPIFGHGGQAPPIPIPRWPSQRTKAASAVATGGKKQKGKRAASREAEREVVSAPSTAAATAAAASGREIKRAKRSPDGGAVLALSLFCFVLLLVPFGGLWDWSPMLPFSALPESSGGMHMSAAGKGRGEGGEGVGRRSTEGGGLGHHERGRVLVDSGGERGGRPPGGRVLMGLEEESSLQTAVGKRRGVEVRHELEGGNGGIRLGNETVLQPIPPFHGPAFSSVRSATTTAAKTTMSSAREGEQESVLILNRTVIGRNMEITRASLIIPRGHEVARVHGNLIIQAVMAGDKAAWLDLEAAREAKGGAGRGVGGGKLGAAMTETERQQLKALASLSMSGAGGGVIVVDYPNSGNALPASASERAGQGHKAAAAAGRVASPGQLGSTAGPGMKHSGEDRTGQASFGHRHHNLDHYSLHHHYDNSWIFGAGGLSGPVLTSGVCTELFQFETSSSSSNLIPDVVVGTSAEEEEEEEEVVERRGGGSGGTKSWKMSMEGRVAAMAATEAARRRAGRAGGASGSARVPTAESTVESAEVGSGAMGKDQGKHGYYDYGRKGGKCGREKRAKTLPSASAEANATALSTDMAPGGSKQRNGSTTFYEDQCRGREETAAEVSVGARGRGGGEVNGSERRATEEEEGDPRSRSFGYGGRRMDKSLPSTMVVSVLLPSIQPGEDASASSGNGGRGAGGGASAGKNGGPGPGPGKLTQIFVVVLVNSVKYVTYSCLLPTLSAAAAATAGTTAAAGVL